MRGTLHSVQSGSRGALSGSERCGPEPLQAPAVLPWLVPHLSLPAGASRTLAAGSGGALLLVCPEEPASPSSLSSGSSAGSMSELGRFADTSDSVQPRGGQEQGHGPPARSAAAPAQEVPGRLPPSGRPLRRVKSRRCVPQGGWC